MEFSDRFKTENDCLNYLIQIKWNDGFICSKCTNNTFWKFSDPENLNRTCKSCRHINSPTSNTLFHKIKFGIRKAFFILFECTASTKSMSANMISRRYSINVKTAWGFMHKVRIAMESSKEFPLQGSCEVDEFYLGGKEEGKTGRGAQKKKKAVVIIEKSGEYGIKRAYMRKIKDTSAQQIKPLFEDFVGEDATILTDKWSAYKTLSSEYKIEQVKSISGKNFKLTHRFIQGLKSWIRGIHHHVSDKYYQNYLNEYCFRFNRNNSKKTIINSIISKMIQAKPVYYTRNYEFFNNT
jgi:transposase-like protein